MFSSGASIRVDVAEVNVRDRRHGAEVLCGCFRQRARVADPCKLRSAMKLPLRRRRLSCAGDSPYASERTVVAGTSIPCRNRSTLHGTASGLAARIGPQLRYRRYMRAHDNADLLLAFCIAIAKHAKVHEAGLVNAAREIGQEIISEYVDVNAPFRVVLPGTWSQDLLAARADGTLDSELLMRTREEVVNVIEEHYLPGFFQSSIFEEVLLTLGSDETVQARSLVLPNQLSAVQRLDATALLGAQEASPSVMDASKRSSRFSSALLRRVRASGMMMSSRREEQHRGEADSHWLESSLCGPSRRVDLEGICTTIDEFSVAQRPLEDLSWA
uniref:RGS domain-containing protein n=1 Tax=Chrysotila carterae TaxID=13221 RepID=A0A7S4B3G2_CHRCT